MGLGPGDDLFLDPVGGLFDQFRAERIDEEGVNVRLIGHEVAGPAGDAGSGGDGEEGEGVDAAHRAGDNAPGLAPRAFDREAVPLDGNAFGREDAEAALDRRVLRGPGGEAVRSSPKGAALAPSV